MISLAANKSGEVREAQAGRGREQITKLLGKVGFKIEQEIESNPNIPTERIFVLS